MVIYFIQSKTQNLHCGLQGTKTGFPTTSLTSSLTTLYLPYTASATLVSDVPQTHCYLRPLHSFFFLVYFFPKCPHLGSFTSFRVLLEFPSLATLCKTFCSHHCFLFLVFLMVYFTHLLSSLLLGLDCKLHKNFAHCCIPNPRMVPGI